MVEDCLYIFKTDGKFVFKKQKDSPDEVVLPDGDGFICLLGRSSLFAHSRTDQTGLFVVMEGQAVILHSDLEVAKTAAEELRVQYKAGFSSIFQKCDDELAFLCIWDGNIWRGLAGPL
ncbi:hypothetical protein [Chromobacterium amazonense]|nr:hypothetical protein [Chromobacterium amazonense]